MSEDEVPEPRLFSKRWWTTSNPYWGEWRAGPWGWVCLVLAIALVSLGVYFLNNTRQGWIAAVMTFAIAMAGTFGSRPGTRRDLARLRRHQYKYGSGEEGDR